MSALGSPKRLSGGRFDKVQFSAAMLAGDFRVEVFPVRPQFRLAMRAVGEERHFFDAGVVEIQIERSVTKLAFHTLAAVFAMDAQFPLTVRTAEEEASRWNLEHVFNLLQGDEFGNLDTVKFEVGIQQVPTILTVNQIQRHVLTAFRARSTGPSGHDVLSAKAERRSAMRIE
jgi:hypothetical protein